MKTIEFLKEQKTCLLSTYPKNGTKKDKAKADLEIQFFNFLIKHVEKFPEAIYSENQLDFSNKKLSIVNKNLLALKKRNCLEADNPDRLCDVEYKEEVSLYKKQMELTKLKKQIKTLTYLLK